MATVQRKNSSVPEKSFVFCRYQYGYFADPMALDEPAPSLPADTLPDIAEFFSYWASLPKRELLPRLADYFENAPPELHSLVGVADVMSPIDWKLSFLGPGLVRRGGGDPTGESLGALYSPWVRAVMGNLVWELVSRPVGYLCTRRIQTAAGDIVESKGICLPLENSPPLKGSVVTYAHFPPLPGGWSDHDHLALIKTLRVTHWIDLGAGVPPWPIS